ncbi:MAG: hypothetical protein M3Y80_10165 [Verrucomicrobiota bacterium]|nr:hypothetical protein [Verrucomicrobiota bacterium]
MIIFGLLASILTIGAAGTGVSLLAFSRRERVSALELSVLSWLFGTGAISLLLWICGMILSGAALQGCVTVIALGLAGIGCWRLRGRSMVIDLPAPRTPWEWLLCAILAVEIGIVFYASFSSTLGWDGLLNWELKARYALYNGGVIPSAYYSDDSRAFTHPAYPLWIPFTELWLYLWIGEAHQFWAKLIFPLIYAAGIVFLAAAAARLTGERWIGLSAAALMLFVPALTNMPGGVASGYVDVPVAILYLGSIAYLLRSAEGNNKSDVRIYALCLALLPWAKREGSVLWLVAALCGLLVLWRQRRTSRVWPSALWLLPGPLVMVTWRIFTAVHGVKPSPEFLPMNFATLSDNVGRIGPISRLLVGEMIETYRWSLFWPLLALSFVWLLFSARDIRLLVLAIAIVGPLSMYAGTYVFSGWVDWKMHIGASLSRLLLHVVPVGWLVIALALRPPGRVAASRADGVSQSR